MRPKNPERCASSAFRSEATSGPLPEAVGAPTVSLRRTRNWLSVGVQVRASSSDVNRDTVMVTPSARKKLPATPVIDISGRKTKIHLILDPHTPTLNPPHP